MNFHVFPMSRWNLKYISIKIFKLVTQSVTNVTLRKLILTRYCNSRIPNLINITNFFKIRQIIYIYWNGFHYSCCRLQIIFKTITKTWKNHVSPRLVHIRWYLFHSKVFFRCCAVPSAIHLYPLFFEHHIFQISQLFEIFLQSPWFALTNPYNLIRMLRTSVFQNPWFFKLFASVPSYYQLVQLYCIALSKSLGKYVDFSTPFLTLKHNMGMIALKHFPVFLKVFCCWWMWFNVIDLYLILWGPFFYHPLWVSPWNSFLLS